MKCVGCGYCCLKATCLMGVYKYGVGSEEVCPALYFKGDRYYCELYEYDKWLIHFGDGCTSSLNTWRREVKQRTCSYCGQRSEDLRESEESLLACLNCDRQISKLHNEHA